MRLLTYPALIVLGIVAVLSVWAFMALGDLVAGKEG